MYIKNASHEERQLITELLKDYNHKGLTISVVEKKRNYGTFFESGKRIIVKRRLDIKDFYYTLAHEVCHFIQCYNGKPMSERKADEFGIMMVNKKFGLNWVGLREKKKYSSGYHKYLVVNKGDGVLE